MGNFVESFIEVQYKGDQFECLVALCDEVES